MNHRNEQRIVQIEEMRDRILGKNRELRENLGIVRDIHHCRKELKIVQ